LLTETDAPFLAPEKGGRSEPAFGAATIKKIAEIKNLSPEETANIIYCNYQRLFS
jgi:TatD DNase family protein